MKLKNKKLMSILLAAVIIICNVSFMSLQTQAASSIYYPGQYSKHIGRQTYFICLNKFTDGNGEGNIFIYKEKGNLKEGSYERYGNIKKISKNKYKYTTKKGSLTFTVQKKSIKVTQKGTVLKNVKLSGTYKLNVRYQRP